MGPTGAEVVSLDQGDLEPSAGSVERDARAGRTTADDEQVEFLCVALRCWF